MNCGREPGGENADSKGVCPAAADARYDGLHGGRNAGRACWAVAGTLCQGDVQGSFAEKFLNCRGCHFYRQVVEEEGRDFLFTVKLHAMAGVNGLLS